MVRRLLSARDRVAPAADPLTACTLLLFTLFAGDLDAACAPHGLAVTSGRVPSTGVCGQMMTTGGRGALERVYGLGVDSVIGAQVRMQIPVLQFLVLLRHR